MEFKRSGDEYLDPHGEDESALVGMLFEKITEHFPDWPMGDRTDLAMSMLAVTKKWAHNLELTNGSHTTQEIDIRTYDRNVVRMHPDSIDDGIN
jgi:hypothetical protein